jgi:chitin disaccharide deacetylase
MAPYPSPIVLVVNADDFGMTPAVNRGICRAHLQGILTSTSLMPNGRAFDDALAALNACPRLGVGIHLSLVEELSVASPELLPGLVDAEGRLPANYAAFIRGYAAHRFSLETLRTEIRAQVRRVLDAGIRPTHMDSHQHLHVLPGLSRIVLDAAVEAGVPVIRIPWERGGAPTVSSTGRRVQLAGLGALSAVFAAACRRRGIRCADHFWGLGASGALEEGRMLQVLERLAPGVNELMCHPGDADEATRALSASEYHRDGEAAALMSPSVRAAVAARGARLAHFGTAWATGDTAAP